MDLIKLKKFYKNKKVFITGNTGFKGIWLQLFLIYFGAKVKGYSLKLKKNDNFIFYKKIKKECKEVNTTYGNILNYDLLKKTIKKFKPDIVFHFAAQSIVIESQKFPRNTFETNVVGSNNLIDICKNIKSIKSVVLATSDKCYFNNKATYFSETSKILGDEPYSSSKANTEYLINIYYKNFLKKLNFGLSSVRAGNVIGGGDFSKYRIIPDIIKNVKNKKILLRNPNNIRPWQHIFDVLCAYLLISKFHYKDKKKYSGPYNVGPNRRSILNVKQLTNLLIKNLGFKIKIQMNLNKDNRYKESKFLFLNSNKIKKKLKWSPNYDINKSLELTSNWYKNFLLNKSLYKFSTNQIKNFFDYQ
tara:strand:+ start:364 stop:1440 length:1077 start_codon:yes stop_codon:yes gene_type:complete